MTRGEVWMVALDPTLGKEIQKARPCVIVSSDNMSRHPLKVIVPFTEWDPRHDSFFWMVRIDPSPANGLDKVSSADAGQIRAVDTRNRFLSPLGVVTEQQFDDILGAVRYVLDL